MAKNKFTFWNRLEGSSYKEEDTSPYEFRVRDPLWMLSRQWQMGEFEAEDNGSPIDVKCSFETTRIAGIKKPEDKTYQSIDLGSFPLESHIESVYESQYSVQDAYRVGQILLEIIENELPESKAAALKENLLKDGGPWLIDAASCIDDQQLDQYFTILLRKNQLDGIRLYTAAGSLKVKSGVGFDLSSVEMKWKQRIEKVMPFIHGDSGYWKKEQLEYEFDVTTEKTKSGFYEFNARNYHNGSVDWFNFKYDEKSRVKPSLDQKKVKYPSRNIIPKGISFPGMPGKALWEMDDPSANLLNLSPEKTELLKVILTDFVLNYGNDWFDFPLTIENGSNVTIKELVVTDVFGKTTPVSNSASNANFFSTGADVKDSLLLLSTNTRKESGKPLEKIIFARDEVANLVFGIEEIIPNGIGIGKPAPTKKESDKKVNLAINEAPENYKLKTEFQHNWIPFVIKEKDKEVFLQRASQITKNEENDTLERIRPKSILLRNGIDDNDKQVKSFFIREEEITKSGVVVQTQFQRTRWCDGKVVTWLGREKYTGQGERNSNLHFDKLGK